MKRLFGRRIKSFLHIIGYEIHKVYKASTPSTLLCPRNSLRDGARFIRALGGQLGFSPSVVIDVGVADGTYELYDAWPEAEFLLVEPLLEFEERLADISKTYKTHIARVAAGATTGSARITITPDLHGSSVMSVKEEGLEHKTRSVPMKRIDDLCEEFQLKGPYLMKIDAQAADLEVLRGSSQTLRQTEVVIVEISFFHFASNGPVIYEFMQFFNQCNFTLYDILGKSYRPLDGALAEIDAVFVKKDGVFRKDHRYATPEQRAEQFSAPDPRFASD